MDQLTTVTMGLQAWSPAQLYESVVDFFANHLNVANHNEAVWTTRHLFDRDVIRKYALGSFTDMLLASAKTRRCCSILNLAQSTKTAVNENYGRELLELHTVGLGATPRADVQNSAKILTGRTLDADFNYVYNSTGTGSARSPCWASATPNSTAAGGEAAGDAYLRYLASHPAPPTTWRRSCASGSSRTPRAPSLVAAVAKAYLANGTRIIPMLNTIVRSSEFWASRGAKVRRPFENVLATIRTLGVQPPESMDVCFITRGGRESFLAARMPRAPGAIVDTGGATVGAHARRRHLHDRSASRSRRRGRRAALRRRRRRAHRDGHPRCPRRPAARRGRACATSRSSTVRRRPARLHRRRRARTANRSRRRSTGARCASHAPQPRVAPGQVVALYDGDVLVGGGIAT